MGPELLLVVLIGGLLGAVFHLWRGRSINDLMTFEAVGIVGFGLGALLGGLTGLRFLTIGQLHVVEGLLVCVGALVVARWLKS